LLSSATALGVWRRWVVANVAGEVVGFGGAMVLGLAVGQAIAGLTGPPRVALAAAGVAAVGTFEGSAVGLAQWLALREPLPALSGRAWVTAAVAGAVVAWGAGMVIGTRMGDATGGAAPPWPLLVLGAAAIGALTGSILTAPQWLVLRRVLPRAG
jgi:hypothetical protein